MITSDKRPLPHVLCEGGGWFSEYYVLRARPYCSGPRNPTSISDNSGLGAVTVSNVVLPSARFSVRLPLVPQCLTSFDRPLFVQTLCDTSTREGPSPSGIMFVYRTGTEQRLVGPDPWPPLASPLVCDTAGFRLCHLSPGNSGGTASVGNWEVRLGCRVGVAVLNRSR